MKHPGYIYIQYLSSLVCKQGYYHGNVQPSHLWMVISICLEWSIPFINTTSIQCILWVLEYCRMSTLSGCLYQIGQNIVEYLPFQVVSIRLVRILQNVYLLRLPLSDWSEYCRISTLSGCLYQIDQNIVECLPFQIASIRLVRILQNVYPFRLPLSD